MPVSIAQVAEALNPRSLYLILLPTERCNFRCTYCYERFEIGHMSPDVVDSVCAFLDRRLPELDRFEIGWFGGEPLLAKDVVRRISAHARRLAAGLPGLTYAANMTTNGYLLDGATATELVGNGVDSYQVSLDGPEDVHNRTRRRADSGGTFARIWRNLLWLRDSDLAFHLTLRVHFSPDTVLLLDPLVEDINREFTGDPRFCVYFKAVERLGGHNDHEIRLFSQNLIDEAAQHLKAKLADPGQAASMEEAGPYVCYASKPNSLVVRATGELAKCTVAFYDERNRLGRLDPDGTLSIDQDRLRTWARGFRTLDEAELGCPLSAMNRETGAPAPREESFFFPVSSLGRRPEPEAVHHT